MFAEKESKKLAVSEYCSKILFQREESNMKYCGCQGNHIAIEELVGQKGLELQVKANISIKKKTNISTQLSTSQMEDDKLVIEGRSHGAVFERSFPFID